MPNNPEVIAQVGIVESKIDDIKEDIRDFKDSQEEMWKAIRKHQDKTASNEILMLKMLHTAKEERSEISNAVNLNKQLCDTRFNEMEKNRKTKLTVAVILITGAINLVIEAFKKLA